MNIRNTLITFLTHWLDILGLYKWEIQEREGYILGEGVGDDNYEIKL